MTELKLLDPTYSIVSFKATALPAQYHGLIFEKWMRSLRAGNPAFKNIDYDSFVRMYHADKENRARKPGSNGRLAVLTDDPDVVLGFSVSREDVLDSIWVHKDNRNLGIGSKLLPKGITTITHITLTGIGIWRKKYKHWKYNPWA